MSMIRFICPFACVLTGLALNANDDDAAVAVEAAVAAGTNAVALHTDLKAQDDATAVLMKAKKLDAALTQKGGAEPNYQKASFHCMGHMINDLALSKWNFDVQGANAVEFDLRFTHKASDRRSHHSHAGNAGAEGYWTFHGPICDCFCNADGALNFIFGSNGVCNQMDWECRPKVYVVTLLEDFARRNPSLVYFDNKIDEASIDDDYKGFVDLTDFVHTGTRLGRTIRDSLLSNSRFKGIVGVGGACDLEGPNGGGGFFIGLLWDLGLAGNAKMGRIWIVWEALYTTNWANSVVYLEAREVVSYMDAIEAAIKPHMNKGSWTHTQPNWKTATSKGVTTCGHIWAGLWDYVDEARGTAGVDYILTWTVDLKDDMRKYIRLGCDGLITNYPHDLMGVAREKGIALPSR